MVVYNRKNYNFLKYISHSIRVYCCGVGFEHDPVWMRKFGELLNGRGCIYHFSTAPDEYIKLQPDEYINEMNVMEESTNAVFCYSDEKHIADTLMLMGYSILCPNLQSVIYLALEEKSAISLIVETANDMNIHICYSLEQLFIYLATQWRETEVTHLLLEKEVMV